MNFDITPSIRRFGAVHFAPNDHALQTIPTPVQAGSVLINDVELLLNAQGEVIGLSGYCPSRGWELAKFNFPSAKQCTVVCTDGLHPDGLTIRLNKSNRWKVLHDPITGTLCIRDLPMATDVVFEVFDGLALEIDEGRLNAIWVRLK